MDELLGGFENLKISALSKAALIKNDVHEVTIGPNSIKACTTPKKSPKSKLNKRVHFEKIVPEPNITIPFSLIYKSYEEERRCKVNEEVKKHAKKFEEFSKAQAEEKKQKWLEQQNKLRTEIEDHDKEILKALSKYEENKEADHQKLVSHYKNLEEKRKENCKHIKEKEDERIRLGERIEKIKTNQHKYYCSYQEMIPLIKSCSENPDLKGTASVVVKNLKILSEAMEQIVNKCKACKIEDSEVQLSDSIVAKVNKLKIELGQVMTKYTERKTEEAKQAEILAKEAAKPPAPIEQPPPKVEVAPVPQETDSAVHKYINPKKLQLYTGIMLFHSEYTKSYEPLLADDNYKKLRFDLKKAVNIPVSAISSVSAQHLEDKFRRLHDLLSAKTVIISDTQINAGSHPLGVKFVTEFAARQFVLQGDLNISNNAQSAFCYASVIVSLWNEHPDFGTLLLANFYKECPSLVPFHIPKVAGTSDMEYYVSQGYKYADGQIEKQDKFLKRTTGIARLYFAILITRGKRSQNGAHPHNIREGYIWFASILKLTPKLDVTATVLYTFFETAGFYFLEKYGNIVRKLLLIFVKTYLPLLEKYDSGGPVSRLKILLQEYGATKSFKKPQGLLTPNFW